MKSTLSIGVAFIILLPLFASFSTAIPIPEKTLHTFKGTSTSQLDNGTVTLTIKNGYNDRGFFSHIGYSIKIDNSLGTKTVGYFYTGTYYYINHKAYEWSNSSLIPFLGIKFDTLPIPFPMYPFKVSFTIKTNTSTNLSLTRTGIMLFNCYVLFIKGNETVTGPS
jgi:hypothetical protein